VVVEPPKERQSPDVEFSITPDVEHPGTAENPTITVCQKSIAAYAELMMVVFPLLTSASHAAILSITCQYSIREQAERELSLHNKEPSDLNERSQCCYNENHLTPHPHCLHERSTLAGGL
jgi:hypothetical protein